MVMRTLCDRCGRIMSTEHPTTIMLKLADYYYKVFVVEPEFPNGKKIDLCENCMFSIVRNGELANG